MRAQNSKALIAIFDEVFATKTRDEWGELLKKEGVVFDLVQSCADVVNDPKCNELIDTIDHPNRGRVRMIKSPGQFSKIPGEIRTCASEVGQHTEETPLDLGYTWEEIGQLKDKKVIL